MGICRQGDWNLSSLPADNKPSSLIPPYLTLCDDIRKNPPITAGYFVTNWIEVFPPKADAHKIKSIN